MCNYNPLPPPGLLPFKNQDKVRSKTLNLCITVLVVSFKLFLKSSKAEEMLQVLWLKQLNWLKAEDCLTDSVSSKFLNKKLWGLGLQSGTILSYWSEASNK